MQTAPVRFLVWMPGIQSLNKIVNVCKLVKEKLLRVIFNWHKLNDLKEAWRCRKDVIVSEKTEKWKRQKDAREHQSTKLH